jgi:hypothetical protein
MRQTPCPTLAFAPVRNSYLDCSQRGTYPSMFEPVHGSAPDIAGLGGWCFSRVAERVFG